jgi:hypothetical protein
MQDAEVELIMRTLVNSVQTYDEVMEVRNWLRAHRSNQSP